MAEAEASAEAAAQDAPQWSAAHEKCRYLEGDRSGRVMRATWRDRFGKKVDISVAIKAAGGSQDDAARICRFLYHKMDTGSTREEVAELKRIMLKMVVEPSATTREEVALLKSPRGQATAKENPRGQATAKPQEAKPTREKSMLKRPKSPRADVPDAPDAPEESQAHTKCAYRVARAKAPESYGAEYKGPDGKRIDVNVSIKAAGKSGEDAARISRLLYYKLETGSTKEDMVELKESMLAAYAMTPLKEAQATVADLWAQATQGLSPLKKAKKEPAQLLVADLWPGGKEAYGLLSRVQRDQVVTMIRGLVKAGEIAPKQGVPGERKVWLWPEGCQDAARVRRLLAELADGGITVLGQQASGQAAAGADKEDRKGKKDKKGKKDGKKDKKAKKEPPSAASAAAPARQATPPAAGQSPPGPRDPARDAAEAPATAGAPAGDQDSESSESDGDSSGSSSSSSSSESDPDSGEALHEETSAAPASGATGGGGTTGGLQKESAARTSGSAGGGGAAPVPAKGPPGGVHLPPNWEKVYDDVQKAWYYFNYATEESSWEVPTA